MKKSLSSSALIAVILILSACSNPAPTMSPDVSPESVSSAVIQTPTPEAKTETASVDSAANPEASNNTPYTIVDTGQDHCYSDTSGIPCPTDEQTFYGQDAQYQGVQARYVDNGDGTITDLNTGLMWQQSPDLDNKVTYEQALARIDGFDLAGYNDWRLPTIKELYSLIDFNGSSSQQIPYIDTDYFGFRFGDESLGERPIDGQYWSSTEYVGTTMNGNFTVFGVNFADGRIKGYPAESVNGRQASQFVRYVRGNPDYGTNDFIDNGDGTISDAATGLMWKQGDSAITLDWEDALAYCEGLEYAGYADWRLPNAKELQSIVDYSRSPQTSDSPAIDPIYNVSEIESWYWTSTTHLDTSANQGVYIAFGQAYGLPGGNLVDVHGAGAQRSDPKSGDPSRFADGRGSDGQLDQVRINNYARCVHGGATEDIITGGDVDHSANSSQRKGQSTQPTPDATLAQAPSTSAIGAPTVDYILFAPLGSKQTYLMDQDNMAVYTWDVPGNSPYLLENGNLLRTGTITAEDGKSGGFVEEIAPDNSVVWAFHYDRDQVYLHHDIEPMPNGNILMIAGEYKMPAEAIAAGRDPQLVGEQGLWPDHIIEVNPETNEIVWEWHIWDHLVQDYDATLMNYGVVADQPELIDINYARAKADNSDWNHTNAIAYNADLDQIMISIHGFSEIWILDHSTTTEQAASHTGGNSGMGGDLLYRWGNPQAYRAGDASDQQLFAQHDARWIPAGYPGAGNVLVFNNGTGRDGEPYSSIDELVLPLDASGSYILEAGEAYGPEAPIWSYVADTPSDFYSKNISGATRLANGNTLICSGAPGVFYEVTPDKDVVWQFDYGGSVFRITGFAADYPGISALNMHEPVEIEIPSRQ